MYEKGKVVTLAETVGVMSFRWKSLECSKYPNLLSNIRLCLKNTLAYFARALMTNFLK